jgi:hypothetical protein
MTRKLKALGLTLVAALALTALAAPAQAAPEFHSTTAHTALHGTQELEHIYVFTAGSGFGGIECTSVTFEGTTTATTTPEQTVIPSYGNCHDSFGRTVHVDLNGCDYKLTINAANSTEGTAHLVCPTGQSVTLTITSGISTVCTVHFPPQTVGGITYHNVGQHITVTVHSTGITSLTTGGFFNCGVSGEHQTEGTLEGATTLIGTNTTGEEVTISVG